MMRRRTTLEIHAQIEPIFASEDSRGSRGAQREECDTCPLFFRLSPRSKFFIGFQAKNIRCLASTTSRHTVHRITPGLSGSF